MIVVTDKVLSGWKSKSILFPENLDTNVPRSIALSVAENQYYHQQIRIVIVQYLMYFDHVLIRPDVMPKFQFQHEQ